MTELEEHLLTIIGQCQKDYGWIIGWLKRFNLGMFGRYSDKMKSAMATKELLDTVDVPENLK